MSASNGEDPIDMDALYGEDYEKDVGLDEDSDIDLNYEDDKYSDEENEPCHHLSPEHRGESSVHSGRWSDDSDGRRSRSPLSPISGPEGLLSNVVVVIEVEDKTWVGDAANSEEIQGEMGRDNYWTPDAHDLYANAERLQNTADDQNINNSNRNLIAEGGVVGNRNDNVRRARGLRGRISGRRSLVNGRERPNRGRGRGSCRQVDQLEFSRPLEEIWVTDDDVPLEMREMARDFMKRQHVRQSVSSKSIRKGNGKTEGVDGESEDEDKFYVTDGRGILKSKDLYFDWFPMDTFRGEEEPFRLTRTGAVHLYTTPYDAFRSFWDDDIIQKIVDDANCNASKIKSAKFQSEWHPTNSDELLCLFAFWMMSGIIRMPTIRSYFSTNPLLKTEIFSRITTLKRYFALNRALHFFGRNPVFEAVVSSSSDTASYQMPHLTPLIDHLNFKFQSNYVLSKNIGIHENQTLWNGSLVFKQFIQSKAINIGIQVFELCESATGYLWSFLVHTEKHSPSRSQDNTLKSSAVVHKLIEPLLNQGYRLFMDDWFNSPSLARFLKRNGTDCVGMLRASRQDVPALVTHAPLKQGQLIARHSGEVCVLSWLDKKRINMISTCHGSAIGLPSVATYLPRRPEPYKPQMVLDYDSAMSGVELKDQLLEPFLLGRKKCTKWYIKLFKRLLNCSIHNARVLLECTICAPQDNLKFRLELVNAIINNHLSGVPVSRRTELVQAKPAPFTHIVHNSHWPVRLKQTACDMARNRQSRLKCVICNNEGRKNQKTPYKCEDCNVPLCMEGCFKKFHTVNNAGYHMFISNTVKKE